MDAPRGNRDPGNVKRKLGRLDEPHIVPLTEFVERLGRTRPAAVPGVPSVPYFDPDEAGTGARVLLLLKDPAAGGPKSSGFVSSDNDDNSAETVWWALRQAAIDRAREVATWLSSRPVGAGAGTGMRSRCWRFRSAGRPPG
ncbi:MAG: hypothetical protein OXG37_00240 [Actinomycetia bacterium]|nr:hypothetical protein [Actinomycetes bacterium]